MVGHGGSSAGSYLTDPTSPIPSHCASIVATSTLRVNDVVSADGPVCDRITSINGYDTVCTCLRADEYLTEYLESPNYPYGYGE